MSMDDADLESRMGRLLQAGVSVAGLTMALGGALYLWQQGRASASYAHFRTVDPELKTIAGVFRGVRALRATAIIQFGVLLMIATPVMRVAFAVFGFAQERDWLYMFISMVVLGLLAYGLLAAG
jgi:uncharacterized membrane protein